MTDATVADRLFALERRIAMKAPPSLLVELRRATLRIDYLRTIERFR